METLRERIARHEGTRLKPYLDTVGKWTIGIGRNISDRGISLDEAYILLDNDIAGAKHDISLHIPWAANLPAIVQEVLVEMTFQMGIGKVLAFRLTLADLQHGNFPAAADSMLQSLWARETPTRAHELANLVKGATS